MNLERNCKTSVHISKSQHIYIYIAQSFQERNSHEQEHNTIVFIKNATIMHIHLRYKLTYYCQYPSKLCTSRKWAKRQNLLKLNNFLMKMEVFVHRSSNAILWLTINFSACFAIDFLNEIQLYLAWLSKRFSLN